MRGTLRHLLSIIPSRLTSKGDNRKSVCRACWPLSQGIPAYCERIVVRNGGSGFGMLRPGPEDRLQSSPTVSQRTGLVRFGTPWAQVRIPPLLREISGTHLIQCSVYSHRLFPGLGTAVNRISRCFSKPWRRPSEACTKLAKHQQKP